MKSINIVYSDKKLEKYVTEFAEALSANGGAEYKAKIDGECEPTDGEILVGETNRAENAEVEAQKPLCYAVKTVNGKLVVKTGGEHSLSLLLKTLAETDGELLGDGRCDTVGNYFDDPNDSSRAEGTELRIVTANTMANVPLYNDCMDKITIAAREEIFHACLDYYAPDIVGLQEFCADCYEQFDKYHARDKWNVLKFKNPNPQYAHLHVYSTIMYRNDLLTLESSDMKYYSAFNNARCRCMTWGIFTVKSTGKRFALVSTHWDGRDTENTLTQVAEISALANSLAEKMPVFTMGDLNSNEWSVAIRTYISNIDSYDCMHADETLRVNKAGSWHDWAKDTPSAGSCDHITATKKDVEVLKFETLMYNQQIYSSDHAWLGVDIKFKN